jgi:protein-tyrosine-phosphatase
MTQEQPFILVVGGADTGRAPMTVALLRRQLADTYPDWRIESAGVTGHDDDPAEREARQAMLSFGLDIQEHRARSLTEEMVAAATLLLPVDSGTAHVVRARYPAAAQRTVTIGELASRQRDIPDPFRMQVGAWISYAREIETLLTTGAAHLVTLVQGDTPAEAAPEPASEPVPPAASSVAPVPPAAEDVPDNPQRSEAIERCIRLLTVIADMPTLIDWEQARVQLTDGLKAASVVSLSPDDLASAYVSLLVAMLTMRNTAPTTEQCVTLRDSIERLRAPIDSQALKELSAAFAGWSTT